MAKSRMVSVRAATLEKLLEEMSDHAKITHSRYDRHTKTYPWNPALYKEADPYRFKLYDELKQALRR